MSQSDFEQITNQIQILKIAKHPNIGKLIDVYETTDFIYLISEYYPGLDLFDYFEKRNFQLKEKNVARIIQQLCSVIYFLGEYGIIHRDLKLENILMTNETDNADIKILDFFSAVFISPKYYQN
jgi:serine/threonine protein kinase